MNHVTSVIDEDSAMIESLFVKSFFLSCKLNHRYYLYRMLSPICIRLDVCEVGGLKRTWL